MWRIPPSSNIIHFLEAERHRKSRSHNSSLEKGATDHSVGITVDSEFRVPYIVRLKFKNVAETYYLRGRKAWALRMLYKAGIVGVLPTDFPAPRWSNYIFDLRQMGFTIQTVRESQWGFYTSSTRTRYKLWTDVEVLRFFLVAAT